VRRTPASPAAGNRHGTRLGAPLGWVPVGTAAVGAVLFGWISIYRHDRFASGGFDLGIFDQTIWGYSRFQVVANTIKGTPDLLGDHFHPILVLLAPAYWLWNDARVLLVAQALLIASASLPIFWWARPRLGSAGASCFQLGFLCFWGVLAGVVFDFHELAVAVPALSFGIYALLERRPRLFWAMFTVGCLTKEDIALTFAAMGVYALLAQGRRWFGLAVLGTAIAWFAITIDVIMPAISGHAYLYTGNYGRLGGTPTRNLVTLLKRPYLGVTLLFDRTAKIRTLAELFGAWLFLPLASPLLLLALPSLAERFWSSNPSLWSTSYQYSLPLAPILAYAAIDSTARLQRLLPVDRWRKLASAIAPASLIAGVGSLVWIVQPLAALTGYMSSAQAAAIDTCLDTIPADAGIAASENLIPHLSHRLHIYRLSHPHTAQYLAIAGQQAHPAVPLTRRDARSLQTSRGHYTLVCQHRGIRVLKQS
jgi:uncharacterized membrane protein